MKAGKKEKQNLLGTWRHAFSLTIPVLFGYIVTGFAMGLLCQRAGYPWWLATLMSVLLYAGSGQFLAVELLVGGSSLIQSALLTLFLNGRHIFYGLSLLDRYRSEWRFRPYMIHSLTDETYALHTQSVLPNGTSRGQYDFLVAIMDQLYWIAGCTLGAIAGTLISWNMDGLDFALPALFIATCVEQLRTAPCKIPSVLGLVCGAVCLILFGSDQFLIPAMLSMTILLFALRKPIEKQFEIKKAECNENAVPTEGDYLS